MLIGTYQERIVNDKKSVYPKIKGMDHPVLWAFPISNAFDGIAQSIITAANVPKYLCVYDIDPSCFIRIDTRKRTELIAEDKFSRDDALTDTHGQARGVV